MHPAELRQDVPTKVGVDTSNAVPDPNRCLAPGSVLSKEWQLLSSSSAALPPFAAHQPLLVGLRHLLFSCNFSFSCGDFFLLGIFLSDFDNF